MEEKTSKKSWFRIENVMVEGYGEDLKTVSFLKDLRERRRLPFNLMLAVGFDDPLIHQKLTGENRVCKMLIFGFRFQGHIYLTLWLDMESMTVQVARFSNTGKGTLKVYNAYRRASLQRHLKETEILEIFALVKQTLLEEGTFASPSDLAFQNQRQLDSEQVLQQGRSIKNSYELRTLSGRIILVKMTRMTLTDVVSQQSLSKSKDDALYWSQVLKGVEPTAGMDGGRDGANSH